ncbi:ribosome recycling factor [Methylobrevis albus]|uniref:Ribosome-recycling factor n=1 Tax=Methylobrevis albus TaxID=2793297 RepID=A0A931MZQ4_9HYPH|nr:ribosome recycling factor [Methylobrevis albus]MBH0239677.1 ribosome recycling factor [Methylobrevis albus]
MPAEKPDLEDLKRRMQSTIGVFKNELAGLRTGRASSGLLEPVMVEAYGASMPITSVATISVPESRMLSVQVWDKQLVGAVDRAIRESNLGLNPIVEGTTMRLPIPELNTERRKDLVKLAHKYAEAARVAIRHVRRDGMDLLKKAEKDGTASEDESRVLADRIQKSTDEAIVDIDKLLVAKEQEIMQV